MLAGVLTKTFRDQRRGLLGWGIGVVATVALMAAMWPSFSDVDFTELLAQYPQAFQDIFNISDMSTAKGFLNAELFSLMLPVIFIIYAVGLGTRLVAGEEDAGTLELLAAMPVSRQRLLLEKAAALIISVGVLSVALFAGSWAGSLLASMDIPPVELVNGALAMFLLGVEFGLIALALSAATGSRGATIGAASGLAGASYVLYLMGQLSSTFEPYLKFSPFYQAISEGPIGPSLPPLVLIMPAVGILALAVSVPVFTRRDLAI